MHWKAIGAAILCAAIATPALADTTKTKTSHALSLLGEPKYGPDFPHLDYVNPHAPKGGELHRATSGTFDTLHPFIIKGAPAAGLGLVFERLMTQTLDDASAEYGLIAESIEVPEDISWVAFNLNPAARWHDGNPITADDVVFSFNILKEKGSPQYRFYYANVSKAEKINDHKVKFTFSGPPNRELPQIMGQLPVLSKAYFETHDFEKTTLDSPLGSGPYRVKEREAGRFITYERVKDYWGKDLPINKGQYNFDTIRFDYYRDRDVELEAFKAGQYDFRAENSAKRWATGYKFPAVKKGLVKVEEFTHGRPTGIQGFAYNLRRPKFQDRALREALAYTFDFEWANKVLFYEQYARPTSYFQNSELASSGLPSPEELKLLEPYRDQLPPEVFTKTYEPPSTDGSGNIRPNLRKAMKILRNAGWKIEGKKLINPHTGKPIEIEFLEYQQATERIIQPMIKNLERLGITARLRMVDPAQYQNRLRDFDFDITTEVFPQSESPGNEQREFWGSQAADRPGSRNTMGIKSPVVDDLIDKIIFASDRESLVTATRALDRVLLWGHYLIPQFYGPTDRFAYWDKFGRPATIPPYGVDIMAWWIDTDKEIALTQNKGGLAD
jgi:microcin C transport system substrate-binding protein